MSGLRRQEKEKPTLRVWGKMLLRPRRKKHKPPKEFGNRQPILQVLATGDQNVGKTTSGNLFLNRVLTFF